MADKTMKYWAVLGIDPTTDESVIKKAYAKQLQAHHPEEDPQGYQLLREAYEWAKKHSRALHKEEVDSDIDESGWSDDRSGIDRTYEGVAVTQHEAWQAAHPESSEPERHPAQLFFEQMEELYDDFPRRIDPEPWRTLMTNDYMWNMEYQGERLEGLLLFLEEHRYLPRAVWEVLNQSFQLLEQKEALFDLYDEDEINYVIGQIQGTSELRYDCFAGKALDFDIEHYLKLRQSAQTLLMEDNAEAAKDVLAEAHALFQEDPDLQLMRAKCYIRLGQKPVAMSCLQQVLELKPNEHEARLLLAQIFYEERRFDEALRECEFLQQQEVLNQDILSIYGNAQIELGAVEKAWKQYTQTKLLWQEFYHFRYNLLLLRLRNKHLFSQEHNPHYAELKKVIRKNNRWVYGFLLFRLSWLYLLLFGLAYCIFRLPPVFLVFLPIILCGSAWKTLRTARMFFS
ncbi:J domain-containing protein [Paenibacillus ihumii]|uniref:J domain-containing protein n=1 Tax=Paenibacillus ihumii TaxID=687436 RepID=UPI0009FA4429|nr:tetratricopeptide repeat protein [Paenibacillus ihumii]